MRRWTSWLGFRRRRRRGRLVSDILFFRPPWFFFFLMGVFFFVCVCLFRCVEDVLWKYAAGWWGASYKRYVSTSVGLVTFQWCSLPFGVFVCFFPSLQVLRKDQAINRPHSWHQLLLHPLKHPRTGLTQLDPPDRRPRLHSWRMRLWKEKIRLAMRRRRRRDLVNNRLRNVRIGRGRWRLVGVSFFLVWIFFYSALSFLVLFNLFFYCSLLFLFSFTKSLIPTAGLYFFLNTGIVVVAIKNHQSVFHRFTCNHQSQHLHQTNHLFPLFSFLFITSSSFLSFLYFVFSSSSPLFLFVCWISAKNSAVEGFCICT